MDRYFLELLPRPTIHVLPLSLCSVGAQLVFRAEPLLGLVWGSAVGGAALAALYWRYVLPDPVRNRMRCYAGMREGAA